MKHFKGRGLNLSTKAKLHTRAGLEKFEPARPPKHMNDKQRYRSLAVSIENMDEATFERKSAQYLILR